MAKKFDNKDFFTNNFLQEPIDNAKLLIKELNELEESFIRVAKTQKEIVTNNSNNKSVEGIRKQRNAQEKLNDTQRIALKVSNQKRNLEDKLRIATGNNAKALAELNLQNREQVALNKRLVNENAKLVGSYKATSNRLKRLRSEYKDLAISEGEASEKTIRLRREVQRLDTQLKKVDKSVGQSQRNVGNYGNRWQKLGATLKSGLGFVGIAGLVLGVGRAFSDAFGRIREFDKELQNIAGITGKSREDLKGLQKDITSVAGSSVKTSNEVAQLASTLFTLGNSEGEVRRLLKPVNDLSIALGATSEESADFLGQTLNAFGKGAESGKEFADIIANVRTSTSLDFQRIKDALGFVAPTANALGLSLGQVSAQIGVLQDNGIKAARAGRLLNTSFARLVEKGLSLDEALSMINGSQNRISTATKLFGKESFTLGLILADNISKTSELANEFDNLSEGSLKTLTDEQLKSMDAQLKILDSTYEKFILNIENGDGALSTLFTNAIKGAIGLIEKIDNLSVSLGEIGKFGNREDLLKSYVDAVTGVDIFTSKVNASNDALEKRTDELADKFVKSNTKAQRTVLKEIQNRVSTDIELMETASISEQFNLEKRVKANLLLLSKLKLLTGEQKNINETIEENTEVTLANVEVKKELIGLINNQAKAVSDLNKQIKEATTEEDILGLSIQADVAKEELDRLKRIVSSSIEEFDKIQLGLIDDQTDRVIAKEKEKNDKLIELIRSNAKVKGTTEERLTLEQAEAIDKIEANQAAFKLNEEIKRDKKLINQDAEFSKAKFEQSRTGFKTEEEFEEEKAAQFLAIKRNQLQAELDLLEFSGRNEDKLRREQLKAQLEGLEDIGKGFENLKGTIGNVVQVIGEVIDEAFEKRILAIGEQLDKTGENVDRLRNKASEGQLESEESLAFEQKKEIDLARQKEREQKKQQRTQAFFSVLSSFQANDGNLGKTIADISVLRALAGGLTGFWEGTDDVGQSLGAGQLSGRDGHIVRVDGSEQVWSGSDRGEVGYRTRDEIKNIVGMYDNGFMMDMVGNQSEFLNPSAFVLNGMNTKLIENKLDEIGKGINGIVIPENHFDYDLIRNLFKHHQVRGNNKKTTVSKLF